jgi:isocitrate dehydrogenase
MANHGAVLPSGALLLEYLQWFESAALLNKAIEKTFAESEEIARSGPGKKRHVTYDIARQFPGYSDKDGASSSAFAERVVQQIGSSQ